MYYMPMRLGDPTVTYPGGVGRSPGYFDCTKRLSNPSRADIEKAIGEIREWLLINSEDPEFVSVQINLMFAGHGYAESNNESGIVIRDGELSCKQLALKILSAIPLWKDVSSPSRLDMYLDCCHSGAVARDILMAIVSEQDDFPDEYAAKSRLGLGRVYCACLDDESSLELSSLGHGLFTYAFLNEFSRKAPAGSETTKLALRDVGWYSDLQQHPFLFDYTNKEGPNHLTLMYPSAGLTEDTVAATKIFQAGYTTAIEKLIHTAQRKNGEIVLNPLAIVVEALHYIRDEYLDTETRIMKNPQSRNEFVRSEYYHRNKFW
jgi:hypothetical protein